MQKGQVCVTNLDVYSKTKQRRVEVAYTRCCGRCGVVLLWIALEPTDQPPPDYLLQGNEPSRDKLNLALNGFEALPPTCEDSQAENELQKKELRKKMAALYLVDFCDGCKNKLDELDDKECFFRGAKVSFHCNGCIKGRQSHISECRLQKHYSVLKSDGDLRSAYYQIACHESTEAAIYIYIVKA
jgi:hypothetical protein